MSTRCTTIGTQGKNVQDIHMEVKNKCINRRGSNFPI